MKSLYSLLVAVLALLFFACQSENKKTDAAAPPNAAAPPAAKAEVWMYAVDVDNLQMRDQPTSKGSNVIAKFSQGDFVVGTGEVSATKEEVNLRGIPYKEPYLRCVSTRPAQENGWLYKGGLTLVYAGTNAESPDLGKLTQLANHLKGLNIKQLSSGKKAWDFVAANFAEAKGSLADAAYIMLSDFLSRMEFEGELYQATEKISWKDADFKAVYDNTFDMNQYPATREIAANGFTLESAEGMIFPIPDWQRIYDFFAPKASSVMRQYLDQAKIEQKDPDSEDGGLAIGIEQLVDRAVFWEKFAQTNPHFVKAEQARMSSDFFMVSVVNGMDNTPSIDYETGALTDDFKKAWAYAQQRYPGTRLAQKCKEISDLFAANGGKRNDAIDKYREDLARAVYGGE